MTRRAGERAPRRHFDGTEDPFALWDFEGTGFHHGRVRPLPPS